ncbi:MAG TPA: FAD-dependent oxidoreductase, partial [Armatimonadota bacterium]
MTNRWQCQVCGYIHRGASPPTHCPSCGAPFTSFVRAERDPAARLREVNVVTPRPAGYRYVIIGNSAAGRAAARALRVLHPAGQVTVISEEAVPVYARPLLPDLIAGMDADAFFASGANLNMAGIDLRLGAIAAQIDTAAGQVVLATGETIPYDALLLATGSAPTVVPWPGADADGIAYFRNYADARRIAGLMHDAQEVAVIGGGLLGLEFVRAFQTAGKRITQIIREPRVGGPAMDEPGSALLRKAL